MTYSLTDDEWVDALAQGRIGLHRLPPEMAPEQAVMLRRRALEKRLGVGLPVTGDYRLNAAQAHCENMIGTTQIPLGVAGPLRLHGEQVSEDEAIFVPLATTEGALIASIARGCRAIEAAGGATVRVDDIGITRAPVLRTRGIIHSRECLAWVNAHFSEIKQACESGSRFLKLLEITPSLVGTSLYLRFRFNSGDAMGMNMATIACERAVRDVIEPATGAVCVSVSGNLCTDKKTAAVNFLHGRGKRIFAEVEIDSVTLTQILKTHADPLCEVQYRKNLLGSIMAGAAGFNAHHANVLAAFFLATGQDIAQIAESAAGVTCIEKRDQGAVYISVLLPDTPLATVGGGTSLATQREALAIMGIQPGQRAAGADTLRLAEILGGAVLAGELSILAAQAAHHLGSAHQQLGRG